MEAFPSKKQLNRRFQSYLKRRDPAPGRTTAESRLIRNTLGEIKGELDSWLRRTDYKPMKGWLPFEHVVTAKDDDYLRDLYAAYNAKSDVDDDGMLLDWHDPGIRSTNRILCVTWYRNDSGGEFLLAKNLYSPLPCERWGRLPLNLYQWRIIAPELIYSTQLWQWVHAVRHYLDDDTFEIGGFMGWHLQECNRVTSRDKLRNGPGYLFESESEQARGEQEWIGRIICKHIIAAYSDRVATISGTPCQP